MRTTVVMWRSVILVAAGLLAPCSWAQQHPNLDRGFDPGKLYQFGEVDSVDLYNGALSLSVPLGPRYPVSETLSYGLGLRYSSNVWYFETIPQCPDPPCSGGSEPSCIAAQPWRDNLLTWNAGLGWHLSLGELRFRQVTAELVEWVYTSPDGAQHVAEGHASSPVFYTKDTSFLRITWRKFASPQQAIVESPDGSRRVFTRQPSGIYLLTKITDAWQQPAGTYPNFVDITYGPLSWTLSDSHGRSHTVLFTADGLVDKVTLAAFGGKQLRYKFTYTTATIRRSCKHTCGNIPIRLNVHWLSGITATDLSEPGVILEQWQFPEYHETDNSCSFAEVVALDLPGVLRTVILPTGGQMTYDFGTREFFREIARPWCTPSTTGGCTEDTVYSQSTAVTRKHVSDPYGTSSGEWLYRFFWHESFFVAGQQIRVFNDEVVTVVRDPANNESAHYFTTGIDAQGLEDAAKAGLPYTQLRGDGARRLSRESFAGPASMNDSGSGRCNDPYCVAGGDRLRAEYVTYERDEPCSAWPGTTCNRRRKDERTYFTGDPPSCGIPSDCTYTEIVRSSWDGLGTYRKEFANGGGSFAPGHAREVWTNSNPTGAPLASEPWVLSTYDYRYSLENGVKNEVRACFERSTGTLKRLRTLAGTSGTLSASDTIAVYERDASGNTSRESIYGGDAQPVNADSWANLCYVNLPSSPGYRVDHTWQSGVRKRSAEVDPASGVEYLLTLDADIDSNTGRTARARDSAGVATDYDYDVLGRLVWIKPQEGPWLRNEFERATGESPALVRTCRKMAGAATPCSDHDNGETVQRWEVRFDGFGRPYQENVRLPGASPIVTPPGSPPSGGEQPSAGTWWENHRKIAFNALGWKSWESEWHQRTDPLPADSQLKKTEFLNFDPFGRPGRIRKPDGTFTDFAYTGVRLLARTVTVSGQPATTEEEYDRHGRLHRVKEPIGAGLEATYTYDVGDRLAGATLVGGSQSQNRTWSYDGRGLLREETLPEIGSGGYGAIFYPRYDARGKLLRRQDPRTRLSFSYDPAGRPLETWEADAAWQNQRLLQSWTYATANGSGDLAKGKLRSAVGYTHWDDATVTVTETYTYGGLAGAVSTRRTRVQVSGGLGGAFDEAFDLELGWGQHSGQVERLRYPQPLGWSSPDGGAVKQAPRRRVDYRFQDGLLTSVLPYYATKLVYHANFLLAELVHARREVTVSAGVQDRTYLDADTLMARPWKTMTEGVTLIAGGPGNWSSGQYRYDGVGNVTAQLADGITSETETFTYDRLSRLTGWTRAGVASESYGFDVFGNLINYNGRTLPVWGATNRLAAAGYDASGNMTAWMSFSFTWDALDRMTALVGNGLARRFAATADGERVVEREGSTYTFSLRGLDNRVLREMKATWTGAGWAWEWEKDSIWGAGRLLASVSRRDGIRHAHVDHLGSPRLLTNRCGQRVALLDHNPWGLDRPTGVQDGERHRFTAHQRDLGLLDRTWDDFDHMHARTYTPYLGRFVSVDPGRDNDARVPQSWNLYAYVRGNPIRSVDPTGKWGEDFHLLVTQYLALSAGRSPGDALEIAMGNQAVDDTLPAGLFVPAAQFDLHFGTLETGRELYALAKSPAEQGGALHCVQDSFSHAGYGRPWGHFWSGTRPDTVYLRPKTAMAAAEETFRLLAGGSGAKLDKSFLEKVFATKDDALRVALLRRAIKALEEAEMERHHVKQPALAQTDSPRKP